MLAFDLYLRVGLVNDVHSEVIALSELLRTLPLHSPETRSKTFRNPSGVARKLADIGTRDPLFPERKQTSGSRLDREIWVRFADDRTKGKETAAIIREAASMVISRAPEIDETAIVEGRSELVFRRHLAVERNRSLVARKKSAVLKASGSLACEVCGFDFEARFGPVGHGVAEVHHLYPIRLGARATKLADLAILCSNCHRMAHAIEPLPTVIDLQGLFRSPAPRSRN